MTKIRRKASWLASETTFKSESQPGFDARISLQEIDLKPGHSIQVDLKLSPDVLEVPVPKFFVEDQAHLLEEREKYLDVLLKEAGIGPKQAAGAGALESMTLESAIRVVQLNERGRQGRQRAKFMKEIRMQEERERRMLAKGEEEREPDFAALLMSQYWRGARARRRSRGPWRPAHAPGPTPADAAGRACRARVRIVVVCAWCGRAISAAMGGGGGGGVQGTSRARRRR